MTAIKCNAKDPNNCRYHRPNAGYIAFNAWQNAEKRATAALEKANRDSDGDAYNEFLEARAEADEAEDVYYATPDGLAKLEEEIATVEDPNILHTLDIKKNISLYYLEEAERKHQVDNQFGGSLAPSENESTFVPPTIARGGDELWPTTKGSNYDQTASLGQVKSKINADIKEGIKKGYLPSHVKYIVRANSGRLSVKICDVADEQLYNDATEKRYNDYTTNARELKDRLTLIVNSYNATQYDSIEGRRNLTKFWENISFEDDWERTIRLNREAAAAGKRAKKKANA